MKTVRLTAAQAIVRFLENQYIHFTDRDGKEQEQRFVRGIYMLPGHGNVLGFGNGIEQERLKLEIYQGKNEQGMALAAMAFAKQMRRKQIIACTSSVGPGACNMITAAATATANNIPLLLLPGDVYASRQPDPVLQQIEQNDCLAISSHDAFQPVCRYWDRIQRPEQVMTAMLSAMRVLTDQANTGAVAISLPQDAQAEAYDYPVSFFVRRVWTLDRRPASPQAILRAADAIAASRHPLLICGGGVRYAEAHNIFRAFAEEFNIPFGETQAGKSTVVWDHPLNLGGIGVTGCLAANEIARAADTVIGCGTRYTDFTTASKWLFDSNARFVSINVSDFQALKMDSVPVVGDLASTLPLVAAELRRRGWKSAYTGEIEAARARWAKEWERLAAAHCTTDAAYTPEVRDANRRAVSKYIREVGSSLTQTEVLACLNRFLDPQDVVISSAGSLPGCMQRMWRPGAPDTYNMEYGYSCMGYEISGAFGAKLAVGADHEVYAMVGDGSFEMLHSELMTAVQEGEKINVVVFDNASYGCINNLQVAQGNRCCCTEKNLRAPGGDRNGDPRGKVMCVDFAAIGRAYGCAGYTVKTLEELDAALRSAKEQQVCTVIDVKVLPKSMTEGYLSWWRVGVPEVARKKAVRAARKALEEHLADARRY